MIKNIIFDFGGVIIDIDYHKSVEAFKQLGVENFDAIYSQHQQNQLFDKLETGKIEPDDFLAELKKEMPKEITFDQIEAAWNALLLSYPRRRINFLQQLTETYPIFLLSNTNAIHEKCFSHRLAVEHPDINWNLLFDHIYYSHEIEMRKPNAEIFERVLNEQELDPTETLFIDDTLQHIEGAQKVGLHTYHLQKGEEIDEVLPRILAQLNQ